MEKESFKQRILHFNFIPTNFLFIELLIPFVNPSPSSAFNTQPSISTRDPIEAPSKRHDHLLHPGQRSSTRQTHTYKINQSIDEVRRSKSHRWREPSMRAKSRLRWPVIKIIDPAQGAKRSFFADGCRGRKNDRQKDFSKK